MKNSIAIGIMTMMICAGFLAFYNTNTTATPTYENHPNMLYYHVGVQSDWPTGTTPYGENNYSDQSSDFWGYWGGTYDYDGSTSNPDISIPQDATILTVYETASISMTQWGYVRYWYFDLSFDSGSTWNNTSPIFSLSSPNYIWYDWNITSYRAWTPADFSNSSIWYHLRMIHYNMAGEGGYIDYLGINVTYSEEETPTVFPPIFTSSPFDEAYEYQEYSYQPVCNQTITTWGLDTNCSWLAQETNGEVHGASGNVSTNHIYWINITATNPNGSCYQNYSLTLYNNPPAQFDEEQQLLIDAYEDKLYSFTPLTTQPITSWNFHTNATWLTEYPATGKVDGTPNNLDLITSSQYYVNWTGANQNGTMIDSLNFTIYMVNKQPQFTNIPSSVCYVNTTYSFNATFDDFYFGGDFAFPYLDSNASMMSYLFFPSNGELIWYPNSTGIFWFNITITDNSGASNQTNYLNWSVTVLPSISPNPAPQSSPMAGIIILLIIAAILSVGILVITYREKPTLENIIILLTAIVIWTILLVIAVTIFYI